MSNNIHKKPGLGDLLLLFRRNIVEALKNEGLKQELTFSQIEVLGFIEREEKATMKHIADYLKVTPPSATSLVSEMEKKGLVKRESDKADRRVVFIVLTKSAKKIFSFFSKRKEIILKKMISRLNNSDQKNLERIIRILIKE